MVLSKLNNHEHQRKQTYESYTFQPLMSFWLYSHQVFRITKRQSKQVAQVLQWTKVSHDTYFYTEMFVIRAGKMQNRRAAVYTLSSKEHSRYSGNGNSVHSKVYIKKTNETRKEGGKLGREGQRKSLIAQFSQFPHSCVS